MSRTQANLLLLLAAAFWGLGNVAQKTVLDHLDPLSAVALRCLIAGILMGPLIMVERGTALSPGWWSSLGRVSALFVVGMSIHQTAFLGTTATNASFLINTATVMTPLAAWLLLRERPAAKVALAGGMTLIGALLLSGGLTDSVRPGDYVAILSAVCYATWMVELGRHVKAYGRPITTSVAQFLAAAFILVPLGLSYGRLSLASAWQAAPELSVLGVFSTAAAFGLQTVAQRFTSASHAAVMVSAECVFAACAAALFLGERASLAGAVGGMLVFAGIMTLAVSSQASDRRAPCAAMEEVNRAQH